jgi:hypothetical protein
VGVLLALLVASGCATPPPQRVSWIRDGDCEIPLRPSVPRTLGPGREVVQGGKLIFEAVIDTGSGPKRVPWLFDTGAGFPLLDDALVKDLAESTLVIAGLGERTELGGLGNAQERAHVLPLLEIPGVCRLANLELTGSHTSFAARDYQGVLGPRAFPGRAVIVDAARQRLVLVPSAEVDGLLARPGTVVVHGRLDRGVLFVPTRIGGSLAIDMIVDTGSGLTNVTASLVGKGPRLNARAGDVDLEGTTTRVEVGGLDLGKHVVFVSPRYAFAVLGTNILLELGRPFLIDVAGERIAVLPE